MGMLASLRAVGIRIVFGRSAGEEDLERHTRQPRVRDWDAPAGPNYWSPGRHPNATGTGQRRAGRPPDLRTNVFWCS